MKIIRLRAYNYKRFALNPEMKKMEYTPSAGTQVLLGSNGSGKTSLLYLLFGLPPENDDMLEDAYVNLVLEKDACKYELEAKREGEVIRYRFLKDGVNLNTSTKVTMQRKLVDEYLKINKDVLALMTGQDALTSMAVNKRKDWFIRSAKTDFTFILGIYDKVKKRLGYHRSVIDHTTKKLNGHLESESYVGEDVPVDLASLQGELEELLTLKDPVSDPKEYSVKEYEHLARELSSSVREYRQDERRLLNYAWNTLRISTVDRLELSVQLVRSISEVEAIDFDLKALYKESESAQSKVLHLKDLPSKESLLLELKRLNGGKNTSNGVSMSKEDFYQLNKLIDAIYPLLPHYRVPSLCPLEVVKTMSELAELEAEYKPLNNLETSELAMRIKELAHLERHSAVNCPKCETRFYLDGYDAAEHSELIGKYDGLNVIKCQLEETRTVLTKKLGDNHHSYDILRQLEPRSNTGSIPAPSLEIDFSLAEHLNRLLKLKERVELQYDNEAKWLEVQKIRDSLKLHNNLTEAEEQLDDEAAKSREKAIDGLLVTKDTTISRQKKVRAISVLSAELLLKGEKLQVAAEELKVYHEKARKKEVQDKIFARIIQVKGFIVDLEEIVRKVRIREESISTLEKELESLQSEFVKLKELERTLSPKKGLIGNTVRNYMEAFVAIMNSHIAAIWEQDMKLIVPTIETLDYTFPVMIEGSLSKDVSETSVGQSEVINLAYKLTMLKMLGYDGYPLILDEFGVHLDKVHRDKAYAYMATLVARGGYSTVFMVSHYADLYGALSADTEFSVLDPRNIETAGVPNTLNTALIKTA